jgi:sugar O-acyltransferase (sialic acid O-acetyltransferase NeuD family)
MRYRVLIIGCGAQGRIAADIFEKTNYHVVGYLDDSKPVGSRYRGYSVLGKIEQMSRLFEDTGAHYAFVAIGDNQARMDVWKKFHSSRYDYARAIHPSAVVMDMMIVGPGAMICAGAVVGSDSMVGPFSIVNTNASLDHDSTLGKFAHLAPGAVTGGHVRIGDGALIGINASIRDRVTIGDNCIIGMGSVVLDDVPDNTVAYGVPCVSVRTR